MKTRNILGSHINGSLQFIRKRTFCFFHLSLAHTQIGEHHVVEFLGKSAQRRIAIFLHRLNNGSHRIVKLSRFAHSPAHQRRPFLAQRISNQINHIFFKKVKYIISNF